MKIHKRTGMGLLLVLIGLTLVLAAVLPSRREAGRWERGRGLGSKGTVGVIRIEGTITDDESGWGGTTNSLRRIMEKMQNARQDNTVAAVVIRINSPGGSAAAAQEVAKEVQRLKESGKTVVISMGDVAASAAYWIASQGDAIVANPATITGSIGVIMQWQSFEELLKKIGVQSETIKSGPHKDIGSPLRPMTSEEREILQNIVDDTYEQFLSDVARGREGKISAERVRELADGRIFTGRQALEEGLVDSLGNFYDAVRIAAAMGGIEGEPQVREFGEESPWEVFFSNLAAFFQGGESTIFRLPVIKTSLKLPTEEFPSTSPQ